MIIIFYSCAGRRSNSSPNIWPLATAAPLRRPWPAPPNALPVPPQAAANTTWARPDCAATRSATTRPTRTMWRRTRMVVVRSLRHWCSATSVRSRPQGRPWTGTCLTSTESAPSVRSAASKPTGTVQISFSYGVVLRSRPFLPGAGTSQSRLKKWRLRNTDFRRCTGTR